MLMRNDGDDRTNGDIVLSHALDLYGFAKNPSFGLEPNEWASLRNLLEATISLLDS